METLLRIFCTGFLLLNLFNYNKCMYLWFYVSIYLVPKARKNRSGISRMYCNLLLTKELNNFKQHYQSSGQKNLELENKMFYWLDEFWLFNKFINDTYIYIWCYKNFKKRFKFCVLKR